MTTSDYVQLWCHFESRAETLKQGMFATTTWILGFASVLLMYLLKEAFTTATSAGPQPWYFVGAALGVLLCGVAGMVARYSASHVARNWERAKHCSNELAITKQFPIPRALPSESWRFQPWHFIYVFSGVFVCAFLVLVWWKFAA